MDMWTQPGTRRTGASIKKVRFSIGAHTCAIDPGLYCFEVKSLYLCHATLQSDWSVAIFFIPIKVTIMSEVIYVSRETLEQMKAELQRMKSVERPAASRAIAEAREKGDLKENAEYDAAKEFQGILESRIKKMESDLANARILDAENIDTSKVSILTRVTITNLSTNKSMTYQIVSEKEADLKLSKISVTSPIGKGLLGRKPGDVAEIQAPNGLIRFRIENITT
jgi:transcription elongation factor GreA